MSSIEKNSTIGVPNVRLVNTLIDIASVLVCAISAWTTADGLATVMESQTMANGVALAMGVASSIMWLVLNHWYPFANAATKRQANYGIIVFCLMMLFGSTLFSVITLGGRDAISTHEQAVLQAGREQGLKYLQQGERELNLVPPLKTYAQIFRDLAGRETSGAVSGISGSGLVVASLRNTASAFDSFAGSVENTHNQRVDSYKRLENALGDGQDLIVQQQQVRGDFAKYQDIQVKFGQTVGAINKELAKLSGLSSTRFLQEANGNLENLTSIIGKGSEAQNDAINRLHQPVLAAQSTLQKLIADNKAIGDMVAPTFQMIPMGYAIFKYAPIIAFAWAIGILLDFLPAIFLFFKSLFYSHFQRLQLEEAKKALPARLGQVREEIANLRQRRAGQANGTPAFRELDGRIQRLKAEEADLVGRIAATETESAGA